MAKRNNNRDRNSDSEIKEKFVSFFIPYLSTNREFRYEEKPINRVTYRIFRKSLKAY